MICQAGEVMQKVVEKAVQYDRNGIEIRFLNDRRTSNVMVCVQVDCETLGGKT